MPALIDWFDIYRFSTGRRAFTFGQVKRVAADLGADRVTAFVEDALAHERGTLEKERLWKVAKQQEDGARGNAVELDNRLDRILTGMFTSADVLKAAVDRDSDLGKRLREFTSTYFPEGPGGVTKLEFEEQLGAMKEILAHVSAMPEEQLREMNVEVFAQQLDELVPEFEAELGQPTEKFRFDILRAARELGHENLCTTIAMIIASYPGREPDNRDKRDALLAPIVEQNERIRARKTRRVAPDVEIDPETGEEIVTPEDVLDPPADDPAEPSVG